MRLDFGRYCLRARTPATAKSRRARRFFPLEVFSKCEFSLQSPFHDRYSARNLTTKLVGCMSEVSLKVTKRFCPGANHR